MKSLSIKKLCSWKLRNGILRSCSNKKSSLKDSKSLLRLCIKSTCRNNLVRNLKMTKEQKKKKNLRRKEKKNYSKNCNNNNNSSSSSSSNNSSNNNSRVEHLNQAILLPFLEHQSQLNPRINRLAAWLL